MEIFIQDISFSYEESCFFGEIPKIIPTFAHISYLMTGENVELKGNVDIDFNEYKEMKHDDITNLIKDKIKEIKI